MSRPANELESKVIVLGLSQSGKTSIRQVIFEGFTPESTSRNPATVRINRLAGGSINLFDIGGQQSYLNEIFDQYKERTFSDVKAAIFVVDMSDAANIMRSKYYFDMTIANLSKISTKAKVYLFAHKMV
ncbi:MAG: ADP-ribosylation factor-like protein [Candidatus Heimdallarchaeota archaeon]